MQIQTKSLLAKLLATENITVEVDDKLPTAAFDPKTRTMFLPKWKEMSDGLQDLLIGHEVGHAFETPAQGWHDAVCDDRTLKGFLNVIEDARIERKIKSRYPGLVRSFYAGYRDLWERDFFGVKDIDVNTLPLIDRINLHFKVGSYLNVQFTAEEQAFVNRCAKTETWEEVEALARELHGKAQETAEEDLEQVMEQFAQPEEGDGDMDMDGDMSYWEQSESDETEDEGSASGSSEQSDGEEDDNSTEPGNSEDKPEASEAVQDFEAEGGVGSITDASFRQNEEKLLDTSKDARKTVYVTVPKVNLSRHIISAKEMYALDKAEVFYYRDAESVSPKVYAQELYKEWIAQNSKTVNQMVSAFEMKRKASLYIKAKTAKTGDLNEDRLWAYKTSDNLFKQVTSVPEGKNHGFIMYLDMSGSMCRNMAGTIDQLITLAMFARKAGIAFDVYGFADSETGRYYAEPSMDSKDGEMVVEGAQLRHILSSSFSKSQIEEAYKGLLLFKASFTARMAGRYTRMEKQIPNVFMNNKHWDLGATPLNGALVMAIEVAKQFRKTNNVEVLNTIILTDGAATDFIGKWDANDEGKLFYRELGWRDVPVYKYGSAVYKHHQGNVHRNVEVTASLIELYKDVTGSKVINYHLLEKMNKRNMYDCRDLYIVGNTGYGMYDSWDEICKESRKGIVEIKDTVGFDVRYVMDGSKLQLQDEQLEVKSNAKGDLLRGFRKFAGGKTQQRIFVQKFIPEVA